MSLLLTQGNALRIPLADESVHMVCCSPPYWGLRDYGTATWEGGDPECDHVDSVKVAERQRQRKSMIDVGVREDGSTRTRVHDEAIGKDFKYRDTCGKCGAIRIDNQLGLEPTPEQYVANMVAVFREVKRVLRADGTLWLNMGDSYNANQGKGFKPDGGQNIPAPSDWKPPKIDGLKPKDLCGIPWRLAFALQSDGWWLRSDIIWSKPNPMPESVTDRPTKAHEYLFLLTKSARYYYDADAVREESNDSRVGTIQPAWNDKITADVGEMNHNTRIGLMREREYTSSRNRRTVWHIATAPYSGAHFATYPPALVEPCIKAGTSERGVCPECGAPWERVTEKPKPPDEMYVNTRKPKEIQAVWKTGGMGQKLQNWYNENPTTTLGWRPTCDHYPHTERWREFPSQGEMTDDEYYWSTLNIRLERKILVELWRKFESVPATVFDPFAGSGTTLQVARALGRNGVGLDLSLEYLHLARQRLSLDALEAWGKGVGRSENGKDSTHKNKQVPRQVHSFHKARKEKGVTDLPMFGGQDEPR